MAVTIAVAAIAALWRIIELVRAADREQTSDRHRLRGELQSLILESENRLTGRIERLENASIGFNRRHRFGDSDVED